MGEKSKQHIHCPYSRSRFVNSGESHSHLDNLKYIYLYLHIIKTLNTWLNCAWIVDTGCVL